MTKQQQLKISQLIDISANFSFSIISDFCLNFLEQVTYGKFYFAEETYLKWYLCLILIILCSSLPPRPLLSHTGHQRSQFPPINGTGVLFVPFAHTSSRQARAFSVFVRPLCLEWASIGTAIAPQGLLWHILL